MVSEIRTNKISSRAGLSTVRLTDTGPVFSGIATFTDTVQFDVNNLNATGVITATSFIGDGSALTGLSANIPGISTSGTSTFNNLNISGVSTFSNPVSIGGTVHFNNQTLFFGPVLNTGEISIDLVDNGIAAVFNHNDTSGLGFFLRSGGDLYLLADHKTSTSSNGDGYGLVIKTGDYGVSSSLGGSIIPSHDYKPQLGLSNRRFGTIFADQGNFSGIITASDFQKADGSSLGVGAGGTWSSYSAGIATSKSVGINTTNLDDTRITGVGNSFNGLYISNGMMVNDSRLDGDHFIGADVNGMMVGPVNVTGTLTVEGTYVVF